MGKMTRLTVLLPLVFAVVMVSWAKLNPLPQDTRAVFMEIAKRDLFMQHIHHQ
jgi:hypothetical protein